MGVRQTSWIVVDARTSDGGYVLRLACGPELCEARVHVTRHHYAAHEPDDVCLHVDSIETLRGRAKGLTRADRYAEAWLATHEADVVETVDSGSFMGPCALCGEIADLIDMGDIEPDAGFVCRDCVERVESIAADRHEEGCPCAACTREREHAEAEQLARDSHTYGGLSRDSLLLLGFDPEE